MQIAIKFTLQEIQIIIWFTLQEIRIVIKFTSQEIQIIIGLFYKTAHKGTAFRKYIQIPLAS